MARVVKRAVRVRGTLVVDPKSRDVAGVPLPERLPAWDEDETTLAIEALRELPRADRAFLAPGIDASTLQVARGLATLPLQASDPLAAARGATGPVLAIEALPGAGEVVASLVDDGAALDAPPVEVVRGTRMVTALRALQEGRRFVPAGSFPDLPMGAYVPLPSWMEELPARLRLLAERCATCGRTRYPPRPACPACRGADATEVALPEEAVLYAATRIGAGASPSEFAREQAELGAYHVGVVEWPSEAVRVTARLVDMEDAPPRIGEPVHAVVRRLFEQEGAVRYGLKFARGARPPPAGIR